MKYSWLSCNIWRLCWLSSRICSYYSFYGLFGYLRSDSQVFTLTNSCRPLYYVPYYKKLLTWLLNILADPEDLVNCFLHGLDLYDTNDSFRNVNPISNQFAFANYTLLMQSAQGTVCHKPGLPGTADLAYLYPAFMWCFSGDHWR